MTTQGLEHVVAWGLVGVCSRGSSDTLFLCFRFTLPVVLLKLRRSHVSGDILYEFEVQYLRYANELGLGIHKHTQACLVQM